MLDLDFLSRSLLAAALSAPGNRVDSMFDFFDLCASALAGRFAESLRGVTSQSQALVILRAISPVSLRVNYLLPISDLFPGRWEFLGTANDVFYHVIFNGLLDFSEFSAQSGSVFDYHAFSSALALALNPVVVAVNAAADSWDV